MPPLAAAAAKHNTAKDQQESQNDGYGIAEPGERWRRVCRRREYGVDRTGRAPWQRLHDVAAGVNHGADSGRRRSWHGQAFLGRAQPRLREVWRRAPAAEPGIVRRVEDEAWAVLLVDHLAGEDDFIAELETDLAPLAADIDRPRPGPRREVEVAR